MKTHSTAKSDLHLNNAAGFCTDGVRANSVQALEHRYEHRKIREQLRWLDWALNGED